MADSNKCQKGSAGTVWRTAVMTKQCAGTMWRTAGIEPECRDEAEDWHEDDGDDEPIHVEDEEEERERMINESQGIIQRYLGQAAVQRSGKRVRSPFAAESR